MTLFISPNFKDRIRRLETVFKYLKCLGKGNGRSLTLGLKQFTENKDLSVWKSSKIPVSTFTSTSVMSDPLTMKERYVAAMVLSGVGDALGYKNGSWEFCHSGEEIHKELKELGGLDNIKVKGKKWIVSDDTVMHLATAEAIMEYEESKKGTDSEDKEKLYNTIAEHYKKCCHDMRDRAPGATCMSSCYKLKPGVPKGYQISFNERGGGCGAAMRSMCIGLMYPTQQCRSDLIAVSVESGRMTHHHPTGFLGSLAGALFTSFAIEGKPTIEWGKGLMDTLPLVKEYIENSGHEVQDNLDNWEYFEKRWREYLKEREVENGTSQPVFPEKYGVPERDKFYKSLSYAGWGGSSGHDAPMIAYDAILGSGTDWKELCSRSMFHSGDSDSTGVMAACWYGAMFGYHKSVPQCNYQDVEYRGRLERAATFFYEKNEKRLKTETDSSQSQASSS
ncbi:hypothetical protein FSP39_006452 [Pinctada imbricata]|uniref:ADP-ribosylhydrolase ARH1 n=1 Tax=Pinctada imbricata TaxID=66713 RepID=A0AA88XZ38_PINIB|nr:hypothetical protein FSP39_006452 [Pinctada imbricata]